MFSPMMKVTAEINHQRPDFLKKKNAVSNLSGRIQSHLSQQIQSRMPHKLPFITVILYFIIFFQDQFYQTLNVMLALVVRHHWDECMISSVINLVASHLRTVWADEFNIMWGSVALKTVYIYVLKERVGTKISFQS